MFAPAAMRLETRDKSPDFDACVSSPTRGCAIGFDIFAAGAWRFREKHFVATPSTPVDAAAFGAPNAPKLATPPPVDACAVKAAKGPTNGLTAPLEASAAVGPGAAKGLIAEVMALLDRPEF